MDIDICVMDIHNWIMGSINRAMHWVYCIFEATFTHNSIMDIHITIMDINNCSEFWIFNITHTSTQFSYEHS